MKCGCTETTPCNKLGCGCKFKVDAGCITYSGADLTAAGFVSGDSLTTILTTINQNFVDYGPGDYITMTTEAPGSHCQYGGLRLDLRSGQTNAIKSTQYLCGVNSGLQLSGSGTLNTLPLWTPNGNTLGDSIITQDGNKAIVNGYLQIIDGSQGNGKVFISDANGVGSWQTLPSSGGIALTDLSGTAPITYNNLTGAIGIQVANTSQGGYLTSTDWTIFNGKGDLKKDGTVALTNHWNAGSFTITSNKLVSGIDATIHGLTVGLGAGSIADNLTIGSNSLVSNTTGYNNIAIGNNSGAAIITGHENVLIGKNTYLYGTGNSNVAIGSDSLVDSLGSLNVAIGPGAAANAGNENVAIGYIALFSSPMTGSVAVGARSLQESTTGVNVAVGNKSLQRTTTGSYNTAIGTEALKENTTGSGNSAIGDKALSINTTGNYNTAIGDAALIGNILTSNNVAIGYKALEFSSAFGNNTAVGTLALEFADQAQNTIAIGYKAGQARVLGSDLHTPTNSIFIGNDTRPLNDICTNEVIIGHNGLGNGNNTTTIGNASTTNFYLHGDMNLKNATAPTTAAVTQTKWLPVTINGVSYKLLLADV